MKDMKELREQWERRERTAGVSEAGIALNLLALIADKEEELQKSVDGFDEFQDEVRDEKESEEASV